MGRIKGDGEGGYHSYLLRLWQVPIDEGHHWRIVLEEVGTGEKWGFSSFDDLLAFLQRSPVPGIELTGGELL